MELLKEPTSKVFNEENVYEMMIYLCKKIQRKEWSFDTQLKNKNGYFDNYKAGYYFEPLLAGFYMTKGKGSYHEVEIRVFNQDIMTFDFYPDGTCKNFDFSYYFLKEENASYFMNELKKTMDHFLHIHGNKLTMDFESLLQQGTKRDIFVMNGEINKKEALSTEQLHEMEKILHERVRPLLTHYEALSEETKQEKKEDVSQALDRAYNTLHAIQEQYEQTHKLALEKQLQLLK